MIITPIYNKIATGNKTLLPVTILHVTIYPKWTSNSIISSISLFSGVQQYKVQQEGL